MKLVLASKNPHKLKELGDILSELGVEVLLESEAGVDVEVEETGTTFEENALLKARAVCEASGLPAVATPPGTAVRDSPTRTATVCCWRICGASWIGGAASSRPSAARSPMGTP